MSDAIGDTRQELTRLGGLLFGMLIVGFLAAIAATSNSPWGRSIGVTTIAGLVGISGGAMLGFLFGIPRTLTGTPPTAKAGVEPSGTDRMKTNTNLEELSDWLTKIIVGVGLTQLNQLGGLFAGFRDYLAKYFPDGDPTPLVASLILVFGLISGFMWLYLETRTIISQVLERFNQSREQNLRTALVQVASSLPGGGTELAPAAEALKNAAKASPGNEAIKDFAVKALAAAGRTDEAQNLLTKRASVLDKIHTMLISLYRRGGYNEALQIANELSNSEEARGNSDYWVYLACAYGQQHHELILAKASKEELQAARNAALDAVKRAVELDPEERVRLYRFAHPDKSGNPSEDDLADFGGDEEFEKVLGGVSLAGF